ncbi:MAG: outer membrane beta-barrel protein [Bacteroidales bacterium]
MKHAFLPVLFLLFLVPVSAQDNAPGSKFELRLGMADNGDLLDYRGTKANLRADLDYNLTKYVSLGGYLGFTELKTLAYAILPVPTETYGHAFHYGIHGLYHFSPHFLKPESQARLDLYLKGKVGATTTVYTETFAEDANRESPYNRIDYGLYLGASFFPLKRVGVNAEFGYGRDYISKVGLAVRLGRD